VFIPQLISEANKPGAEFSIYDHSHYKSILEGYCFNDVLIPMTKILRIKGQDIKQLRSQDSENP